MDAVGCFRCDSCCLAVGDDDDGPDGVVFDALLRCLLLRCVSAVLSRCLYWKSCMNRFSVHIHRMRLL